MKTERVLCIYVLRTVNMSISYIIRQIIIKSIIS